VLTRYSLLALGWTVVGVAIAIAMSVRYEAELAQLAPQPVVATVMAALWLLLATPVLAAVGVPLVQRYRARTR
jgi:hypothetical protein